MKFYLTMLADLVGVMFHPLIRAISFVFDQSVRFTITFTDHSTAKSTPINQMWSMTTRRFPHDSAHCQILSVLFSFVLIIVSIKGIY